MMMLSDRDAFYEKMYFHEIAVRDRLDEKVRTLLAVEAIVITLMVYLFNAVIVDVSVAPAVFWLVYGLALISLVASIYCYIKAWHSQHYTAFPLLRDMEHYIGQIRGHYQQNNDERTAEQWTEEAFDDYMRQSFIDHASLNAGSNDNKRFWLYYGNSFIISAFVFSVMAFFPVSTLFLG